MNIIKTIDIPQFSALYILTCFPPLYTFPFSSPEATLLLVSTKNSDLWPGPTTEVRDSRTSCHSAHALSQVWQIWLVLVSIYCVYKSIQKMSLDQARGRDSWCWPKGARPLGTRMTHYILIHYLFVSEPTPPHPHIFMCIVGTENILLSGSNHIDWVGTWEPALHCPNVDTKEWDSARGHWVFAITYID